MTESSIKPLKETKFFTLTQYDFKDLFKIKPDDKLTKIYPGHPFGFKLLRPPGGPIKSLSLSGNTGAGIYFFTEKINQDQWRPAYVGIRADGKAVKQTFGQDNNSSSFHSARVYKHLQTDTFRFRNAFGINQEKTYDQTRNFLEKKIDRWIRAQDLCKDSPLCKMVLENSQWWFWRGPKKNWKDIEKFKTNGIETSEYRFAYACHNWNFFNNNENIKDDVFNECFKFYFIKLNEKFFNKFYFENDKIRKIFKKSYNKNLKEESAKIRIFLGKKYEQPIMEKFHPLANKMQISVKERIDEWSKKNEEDSDLIANKIGDFLKNVLLSQKEH